MTGLTTHRRPAADALLFNALVRHLLGGGETEDGIALIERALALGGSGLSLVRLAGAARALVDAHRAGRETGRDTEAWRARHLAEAALVEVATKRISTLLGRIEDVGVENAG